MGFFGRTKIIVTLGPATHNEKILKTFVNLGVRNFRLNFSYGTHEQHRLQIEKIRALESKIQQPLGIIVDLQGRKIRLGKFKNGRIHLGEGNRFQMDLNPALGDQQRVYLPQKELYSEVQKGDFVFVDGGKLSLQVIEACPDKIVFKVRQGGFLSDQKGVTIPKKCLKGPVLTEKDLQDLEFAVNEDIDWVAVSYVQNHSEVREVQDIVQNRVSIISKIEHPNALKDLDNIISQSQGVMVARGDLGLEINPEDVPQVQKRIVSQARKYGKPVIVATQMLESMIASAYPTRAEVSDVATAVYQGADGVMLSEETAIGLWPGACVGMMKKIIIRTQKDPSYFKTFTEENEEQRGGSIWESIGAAVQNLTDLPKVRAILSFAKTGKTVRFLAKQRPKAPIVALTPFKRIARELSLTWGVCPCRIESLSHIEELQRVGSRLALQERFCKRGDLSIVVAGVPLKTCVSPNLLRVLTIESE